MKTSMSLYSGNICLSHRPSYTNDFNLSAQLFSQLQYRKNNTLNHHGSFLPLSMCVPQIRYITNTYGCFYFVVVVVFKYFFCSFLLHTWLFLNNRTGKRNTKQ